MNIYRILDDGEAYCVRAETMQAALDEAAYRFVGSLSKEDRAAFEEEHGEAPAAWWQRTCLESCELIGELVNDSPMTWQG